MLQLHMPGQIFHPSPSLIVRGLFESIKSKFKLHKYAILVKIRINFGTLQIQPLSIPTD
jgi:hypothetical protein